MLRYLLPILVSSRTIRASSKHLTYYPSILKSSSKICHKLDFIQTFSEKNMQCGPGSVCGFSKEDLKERLTLTQYQVTQEKDTERAFTGKYYRHEEKGIYSCIVCGEEIFSSEAKFPTPCGWPAFFDVIDASKVKLSPDFSHVNCNILLLAMKTDMQRMEVSCAKCSAHMGHLFDDGPKPTGKRYCINSASLDFQKAPDDTDAAA